MTVMQYLVSYNYPFVASIFLLIVITCILFWFCAFHIYLISQGTTTNERTKRGSSLKFLNLIKKSINDYIEEIAKENEEGKENPDKADNQESKNNMNSNLPSREISLTKEEIDIYYQKLFKGRSH